MFDVRVKTVVAPTATGTQTIDTGLGEKPSAIMIMVAAVDQPPDTYSTLMTWGYGMCDDQLNQRACGIYWPSHMTVTQKGMASGGNPDNPAGNGEWGCVINVPDITGSKWVTAEVTAFNNDGTIELLWTGVSGVAFAFGLQAISGVQAVVGEADIPGYTNTNHIAVPFKPQAVYIASTHVLTGGTDYSAFNYAVAGGIYGNPDYAQNYSYTLGFRRIPGIFGSPGEWTGVELWDFTNYANPNANPTGTIAFLIEDDGFYAQSDDTSSNEYHQFGYLAINGDSYDMVSHAVDSVSTSEWFYKPDGKFLAEFQPYSFDALEFPPDPIWHQIGVGFQWLNRVCHGWIDRHGGKFSVAISGTTDYLSVSTLVGSYVSTVDLREYGYFAGYKPGTGTTYDGNPAGGGGPGIDQSPFDYVIDGVVDFYEHSSGRDWYAVGYWTEAIDTPDIDTTTNVSISLGVPITGFIPQIYRRMDA